MKKSSILFLSLLLCLSLLLSACAAPAVEAPVVEEPVVEATEEEAAEPTAIPPTAVPTAEPEADLDGAYTTLLGNMQGYNVIDSAGLNEMLAEEPPFILDVRSPEEEDYEGHIEGAVVIPLREIAQNVDKLPSFDTPIVIYCKSGHRSTIAMTVLNTLGWTNAKTLRGGFLAWKDAGNPIVEGPAPEPEVLNAAEPDPLLLAEMDEALSNIPDGWAVMAVEDLSEQLADGEDILIIDVRKPAELEETGVIEGAVNIPLEQLIEMKDQWPADLDAKIVLHCRTGVRSAIAEAILWSYGYTDLYSLKGGIVAWQQAGYPTVGGLDNAYTTFIANMEGYNFTDVAAVNEMLAEEPPFLLDVRTPEDLAVEEQKGYIEGATLIPLRELTQNLDKLPDFDTPIVVICRSGWRATIATTALETLGWTNVKAMKGGMLAWKEAGYPVVEGVPAPAETLGEHELDPALVARLETMITGIPENWGGVAAEALVEQLAETPDLILIDVRTADEQAETGIIEGAMQIPLEEMIARKAEWPANKEAQIVVYCKSGGRGTIAMSILRSYGYTNVTNLSGGLDGWVAAGNPTVMVTASSN